MTGRQRSLISGISVLGVAGLICKMVGVLYRIPLANMIGGQGLGLYQQVMPAYNLLLAVTSAGIPVAISRMVSYYITMGEHGNARRVFHTALKMLSVLGVVTTLLLFSLSRVIAKQVGTPEGYLSYMCIAPSLFCMCDERLQRIYAGNAPHDAYRCQSTYRTSGESSRGPSLRFYRLRPRRLDDGKCRRSFRDLSCGIRCDVFHDRPLQIP